MILTALFLNAIALVSVSGFFSDPEKIEQTVRAMQQETMHLVKWWAEEIGKKLNELSVTMTRQEKVKKSFESLEKHLIEINGNVLAEEIASDIRKFMGKKIDAVQQIADYAEFLSYYRPTDEAYKNETRDKYYYYDTDGIVYTDRDEGVIFDIEADVFSMECSWWCKQRNLSGLIENMFTSDRVKNLFSKRQLHENEDYYCNCRFSNDVLKPKENYTSLPLLYDPNCDDYVNFNMSVVKVATNIYERDMTVLEGIRWSEPLDLVFKKNYLKDQDLVYQYFASPTGFMRHYPGKYLGVKWSEERYYQTYDFRTRSWFTEAMTSPKDIIILLDKSGSMQGKRKKLSHQIVNDILDTLNDNDFVNIYTFNNETLPLVNCFNDTLFQANEENLRLLREYLPVYSIEFAANISLALEKAFKILAHFRKTNLTANCNQAIMLITEGIDYPYDESIFKYFNWKHDFPVRIFTYALSTEKEDERQLEYIACSNMGYYVNMTTKPDIREKVLKYLNVMSRPINFNWENKQTPIWSYLYVDLADRRLSNWLWNKFEGIRQREIFLDHVKRRVERFQMSFESLSHMLLQESHEYEKYEEKENYKYMTTVSLPVYGRRENESNLIGVAGVDVPIRLFRTKIPHDQIGVNGYAFIITNNGYILMHPEHRTEFEYILKPTFNRVDILETEILDDDNEPRIFGEEIVKLRENMLKQKGNYAKLNIKYTLDDMKRIIKATRHYYYTPVGPFTFCVALPDKYGHVKVNRSAAPPVSEPSTDVFFNHDNWNIHPDWMYCINSQRSHKSAMGKIQFAYDHKSYRTPLFYDFLYDLNKTAWFDETGPNDYRYIGRYYVHKVFLATSSGLSRWKTWNSAIYAGSEPDLPMDRAIDEDWYQRSVEENFKNENMFIFSVPFEISGYENNTMIRGTKAIFVEKNGKKTPIAVVGLEFNHQAMFKLYRNITNTTNKTKTKNLRANITCESSYLTCFILDNNAYILLSDEIEYTGRFIGDIRPDIMYYLVNEQVFNSTRMFDYQATCQFEPPKSDNQDDTRCPKHNRTKKARKYSAQTSNSNRNASFLTNLVSNVLYVLQYLVEVWLLSIGYAQAGLDQMIAEETNIFQKLKVNKTVPTPCDREMWLFTLQHGFRSSFYDNESDKFTCNWYSVHECPGNNLDTDS